MKKKSIAPLVMLMWVILVNTSCSQPGPKPIRLNKDECAYCKMTVTHAAFASQINTAKGRQYVFDDLGCMVSYIKENAQEKGTLFYVADFCKPESFIDVNKARIMSSDSLRSPMRGNMAAFSSPDSLNVYMNRYHGKELSWSEMLK